LKPAEIFREFRYDDEATKKGQTLARLPFDFDLSRVSND